MDQLTYPYRTASAEDISERDWSTILPAIEPYDEAAFRFCVVIASRLDSVSAMDAVGHSLVALGAAIGSSVLGLEHADLAGVVHARLARYPVISLSARPMRIARLVEAARSYHWVACVDYPDEGQSTTNDSDYGVALSERSSLTYRAAALFGPRAVLDDLCGHFSLYRARERS
jgi:Protein of unknown function (DUF2000)